MERLNLATTFLKGLTQLGLGIIAFLFVLQVLIGPDHLLFPVNTMENMIQLSGQLGPPGLGIILGILALAWVMTKE
jgi:hypothetical protein